MMSKSRKICAGARGRDEQLGEELDTCSMYTIHELEQVCQRCHLPRLGRILSSHISMFTFLGKQKVRARHGLSEV